MSPAADAAAHPVLRVAVIGADDEGARLARAFTVSDDWELMAVCDEDRGRAQRLARRSGDPAVVTTVGEVLADHDVDALAIAPTARYDSAIVLQAIAAGKHVLVERPLAGTTERGTEMVAAARAARTILMADHTDCYTPAVIRMREMIASGELGEIRYVDSVRIDLGPVRPDVDVFWDLAPHDLAILDFVLPGGLEPLTVSAQGADPLRAGKACVGYLSLPLAGGALAHVHVNWLSPTRIRRMVIGGSRKTLVWDDLKPTQRLSVFDGAADPDRHELGLGDAASPEGAAISHRLGDTWSPALSESEPLGQKISSFAAAIRGGRQTPVQDRSALRVLCVLEAATASLRQGGATIALSAGEAATGPRGLLEAQHPITAPTPTQTLQAAL